MSKVFFLGGLPRAGSTKMSNVLDQNPALYVSPTSPLAELIHQIAAVYAKSGDMKAALDTDEQQERIYGACRGAIEGWYRNHDIAIDKGRYWLGKGEFMDKMYPEGWKVIAPIRDLRGIASSMEKLIRKRPVYMMAGGTEQNNMGVRLTQWFNSNPLGTALNNIRESVNRGYADKILFVRMEDYCKNPKQATKKMYKFLDLPLYDHDFINIEQTIHEHDAIHLPFGDHQCGSGAIRPAVEDWLDIIGADMSADIVRTNKWFYETFYPERLEG